MSEALFAVSRDIGHMANLAEGLGDVVGGVAVVFDDQETHDEVAVAWVRIRPGGRIGLRGTNHSGHGVMLQLAKGRRLNRRPSPCSAPTGATDCRHRAGRRGRVFLRTRPLVWTTGGGDECRWYA